MNPIFIIARSHSYECLEAFVANCQQPLKSYLDIEIGYTNKLFINEETWKTIPEDYREKIKLQANNFVDGWEARANLKTDG